MTREQNKEMKAILKILDKAYCRLINFPCAGMELNDFDILTARNIELENIITKLTSFIDE